MNALSSVITKLNVILFNLYRLEKILNINKNEYKWHIFTIFFFLDFFLGKIVDLLNKIFETILGFLSLKNEIYNFLIFIF